jgi:hypothetical protein
MIFLRLQCPHNGVGGNLFAPQDKIPHSIYLCAEVLPLHEVGCKCFLLPLQLHYLSYSIQLLVSIHNCSKIPSPIVHLVIDSPRRRHCNPEFLPPCEGLSPTARWALSLPPGHSQKAQIDDSISAYYSLSGPMS